MVLDAELVALVSLEGDFAFKLANVFCLQDPLAHAEVEWLVMKENRLTFSPGAEGAGRDLVPELAAVLAAELLALLTCKETLVFVHIPILHLHNMRELAALADLVDNAGVINQKVPRK